MYRSFGGEKYLVLSLALEEDEAHDYAVVDTLSMDGRNYVALAPVEGDELSSDVYFYRLRDLGDDAQELEPIEDDGEFNRLADYFIGKNQE